MLYASSYGRNKFGIDFWSQYCKFRDKIFLLGEPAAKSYRLPNLVVITLLENYDYFVHTLGTIGNQWEIFVYRFDLPVTSLYNNDICEKFMISMNFGDWIHLITHCSMI